MASPGQPNLPPDSFVTCSTDNTARIWSLGSTNQSSASSNLKRNIYSKELLKIIYIDNDLSALCEIDQSMNDSSENQTSSTSTSTNSSSQTPNITNIPTGSINNLNSNDINSSSLKMGARCLKLSPDGQSLATGDRNGNIRIYDTYSFESVCMIEAHEGEILYLQYSQPESGRLLLASSSRDRLIHIFDATRNKYDLIQTLDDHSAAITAVRFSYNQMEKQLYLISCGADKSIMFRTANNTSENFLFTSSTSSQSSTSTSASSPNATNNQLQFTRTSYVAEKQTFYDLNIDPTRNYINTISQDRMVRTYSIKDGKKLRQFRGSLNEDGYLLKMDMDKNGSLLATSCTDKCVYVWDLNTSECVAYIYGHSEVVTDLKFTHDNQHLITVSGDGCIFVWRLNNLFNYLPSVSSSLTSSSSYHSGLSNAASQSQQQWPTRKSSIIPSNVPSQSTLPPTFKQPTLETAFENDNDLPAWARNKLNNGTQVKHESNSLEKFL